MVQVQTTTVLVFLLHLLVFFPGSSSNQQPPSDLSRGGVLKQEKMRLGSTPPSCYNRCNECHPCMAVQVATIPSHDRSQPGSGTNTMQNDSLTSIEDEKYSNYKALEWKCRCGSHFFNP